MTKNIVQINEEKETQKTIRFGCTPTFYDRAGQVAEKKGISRPDLAKYALQKEIEAFEQVHGPLPSPKIVF